MSEFVCSVPFEASTSSHAKDLFTLSSISQTDNSAIICKNTSYEIDSASFVGVSISCLLVGFIIGIFSR